MEREQRNIAILGRFCGRAFINEIERGEVVRVSEKFRGKWVVVYTKANVQGYEASLIDDWDCWIGLGIFRHACRGNSIAEAVQNVCIGYCEPNWRKFLTWKNTGEQMSLFEQG